MRAALAVLVLVSGCDIVWRVDQHSDAAIPQDMFVIHDVSCPDGVLVGRTGGNGLLQICVTNPAPTKSLLGGFDTLDDSKCDRVLPQADGTTLCAVIASHLTVTAAVDTRGARPLVLVGVESIELDGNVNLAGGTGGAGSNYLGCGSDAGTHSTVGGGGGGGGSFGDRGGQGGDGKGKGGNGRAPEAADRIRGGCKGGSGGSGDVTNYGGGAGDSGGALYMMSNGSITVNANVNASGGGGGGGRGGVGSGGGGGGGSGGMIAFDAPTIVVTGTVFANGGGGGSSGTALTNGGDGDNPTAASYNMAAAGGTAVSAANGGAGAAIGLLATVGASGTAGGGGGGGAGYILVYSLALPSFMASPMPLLNPMP